MARVQRQVRKGAELVKLSTALYRELALSALQLVPLGRARTLLRPTRIRSPKRAWV